MGDAMGATIFIFSAVLLLMFGAVGALIASDHGRKTMRAREIEADWRAGRISQADAFNQMCAEGVINAAIEDRERIKRPTWNRNSRKGLSHPTTLESRT